ncbi:MAG: hypothetical protein FWC26_03225 [Fibromonadales bacterium]|nr:hypothetical protein [Fibromonadales bacterium]
MKKLLPVIALCFTMSFAQFENDEWADFNYQEAGLSQTEFQNVKESGMSKDKLLHLLEIGVKPSAYLKQPWNDLKVSEEEWLKQRSEGMEDSEIDRTYRNKSGNQGMAYLSFLVPSIYQWYTDQTVTAIAMDAAYLTFWGITIFVLDGKERIQFGAPLIAAIHVWSGVDALISTLWDSNPDARNFSWGIVPLGKNSVAAAAMLRF